MKKIIPVVVEEKFEAVKAFAESDITFSKGMFGLFVLAALVCGFVIGILVSPKGAKVKKIKNNEKRNDSIDDFNDFCFEEDEEELTDDEDDEDDNSNRSKYIKL